MPWIPLVAAGVGLAQSVIGGIKAKKAREQMEAMQPPKAAQDQSVSRYYNEALRRYGTAPTSTFAYKNAMQNVGRNQNFALNALRDRRGLIGGVSSIVGRSNDAALNAASIAEREQANRFAALGGATSRKSADDRYLFGQNQLAPYQKDLTLTGMKAQANAQTMNTGISNIYSGLMNYGMANPDGFKWSNAKIGRKIAATPGLSRAGVYGNPSIDNEYGAPPQ